MKRVVAWLMMAVLLLGMAAAEAPEVDVEHLYEGEEYLRDGHYIDAPNVMTHDSVVELLASQECRIETLEPDEAAIALLNSVYEFVWAGHNRPARYYDEATQRKIAALIAGDIDALHMTEAMRLQLTGEPERAVRAIMRLDVEYHVGQLVVVVLGVLQEDGSYEWYPYRGRVQNLGEIRWEIPREDWESLSRQPVAFHVLTDRIGGRGGKIWHYIEYSERMPPAFSKDAGDVKYMRYWYSEWGEPIDDNFNVWLVDLTRPMELEVMRIGEHLAQGLPILDYFPQERKAEALLMLPADVAPADLVPYDVIALKDKDYKDTYGDVNVEIIFATAYDPEKAMVVLAGFPNEEDPMEPFVEWYVLRAEALLPWLGQEKPDSVEIGLKQLFLPWMEEKPIMLVVISEMLDEEITDNVMSGDK